jgi:hypothetical protein
MTGGPAHGLACLCKYWHTFLTKRSVVPPYAPGTLERQLPLAAPAPGAALGTLALDVYGAKRVNT